MSLISQNQIQTQQRVRPNLAVVKNSPIVTDIQGSLGPWTFTSWRGVKILKKKPQTADVETDARMDVRHAYGRLTELWKSLPSKITSRWNAASGVNSISGFNLFMSINISREIDGNLLMLSPPNSEIAGAVSLGSNPGPVDGAYLIDWSGGDTSASHNAYIIARWPWSNQVKVLSENTVLFSTAAFGDNARRKRAMMDFPHNSYVYSERAIEIKRGTFSCICKLNSYPGEAGHNMSLIEPRGTPHKGIEIAFGSDAGSNISIFITGEQYEDWDTYKETDIISMISKGSTFSVIVEWEFIAGSSVANFYIDGNLATGTTHNHLSNWDEFWTPESWMFGGMEAPFADRVLDNAIDDICFWSHWLTPYERSLVVSGQVPPAGNVLCYNFDDDTCGDSSPEHNDGALGGNADIDDTGTDEPFQLYLINDFSDGLLLSESQAVLAQGSKF